MKFYCVASNSVDHGICLEWFTSRREARKCERGHNEDHLNTKEIDVPTDKAGLVEWLNQNCTRDNG